MIRRRWLWALMVAALAAALVAAWVFRTPTAPAVQLRIVPLVRTLQFSARVATASRVEVGATVTGRVAQVLVAEGARVRQGDALVRLEADELQATLSQALASEQQAAARLAGLRSTGRQSAQAGVVQAESVLTAAQAELGRTQDLVAKGFVSEARLDETQRAVAVARAQLAAARAQGLANADAGTDVAQAQAQWALAVAGTAAARARLAQALITAPADATVLSRTVEPGQIVQAGRALLGLALSSPLTLEAQVDERYLEQLAVGQAAEVVADAFPSQRFAARVQSIAPLVDAQRGAIEVKFGVDGTPPSYLREDMTLSVAVQTARRDRALALPAAALRDEAGAGGATVLRVRDGRVESVPVTLGLRTLEAAEVLKGLAEGDVVLLGPARAPGSRVRPDTAAAVSLAARPGKGEDAGSALTNAMGR
ncbi:efflux RND transporter periplasmic adaptor subunit [Ideonella sp. A 288]|uniref:efflux RND transporter periplasmic adaptor subunit n=1 Tax=Ideonella sp. A 288 TaxID=1962181 RepID=UPI000B4B4CEA|nr:efflux RND transporter periplasmic adaptor subunit [Ideonella sp. A 288]